MFLGKIQRNHPVPQSLLFVIFRSYLYLCQIKFRKIISNDLVKYTWAFWKGVPCRRSLVAVICQNIMSDPSSIYINQAKSLWCDILWFSPKYALKNCNKRLDVHFSLCLNHLAYIVAFKICKQISKSLFNCL